MSSRKLSGDDKKYASEQLNFNWHDSCLDGIIEMKDIDVDVSKFSASIFGRRVMLGYAITFLIIALVAAAMGFGLVGGMAYGAAKICFFVFLVLAILSFLSGRRINVS